MQKVTVLGGTGFVGSALVQKLDSAGYEVKVLSRRREKNRHLILLPNVQVIDCNVFDQVALKNALKGSDIVINLIGILHQSKKLSFKRAHTELPMHIADACQALGIARLLQMSALQASTEAPSQYLRSKAAGELAIKTHNKVNWTIFRPSVIFGRDDNFINMFATLTKLMPIILLANPHAKFQPIWVEDVATAFVNAINNIDTFGQTYELAGPNVYSLQALVQYVANTLGLKRRVIGLNPALSYAQALMMEMLPIKLMTRDNLNSMKVDSVMTGAIATELNIQTTKLEAVVPQYLMQKTPRAAYDSFRGVAGR